MHKLIIPHNADNFLHRDLVIQVRFTKLHKPQSETTETPTLPIQRIHLSESFYPSLNYY